MIIGNILFASFLKQGYKKEKTFSYIYRKNERASQVAQW